jgi:hypothetical protein
MLRGCVAQVHWIVFGGGDGAIHKLFAIALYGLSDEAVVVEWCCWIPVSIIQPHGSTLEQEGECRSGLVHNAHTKTDLYLLVAILAVLVLRKLVNDWQRREMNEKGWIR